MASFIRIGRGTAALAAVDMLAITLAAGDKARSTRIAAAIVLACLIEAILILSYVVASLGLGYESYSGLGPDRPPPAPLMPAPAPPPNPHVILP